VLWNSRLQQRQIHDFCRWNPVEEGRESGWRHRCQRRFGRTGPRSGGSRRQSIRGLSASIGIKKGDIFMSSNRGVVYVEPGKVEVKSIAYPKLKMPASETNPFGGKDAPHGVILKVVTTNICGSDQHMVRGRTTAPLGLILGHEITGQVIEAGRDVEFIKKGDLVSVPFNIACGRCRNCKEGKTGICLSVNPARPGAAYGYVDMGGWVGGQAEYVMVPYADFNLLKLPNEDGK